MKKFIRGTWELDENVTDLVAYEEQHVKAIEQLIEWANSLGVYLNMGISEDNYYLCEYVIRGNTASYCKGICSELKHMLKAEFPKVELVYQGSGDYLG